MAHKESSRNAGLRSPVSATAAALAVSFSIAYLADSALHTLREEADTSFIFTGPLLLSSALPYAVMALSIGFAWLLLVKLPADRTAAILALVTGILLSVAYLSLIPPFGAVIWAHVRVPRILYSLFRLSSQSAVYYLAASWTVTGLAALIARASRDKDRHSPA